MNRQRPLRFALLVNDEHVSAWQALALQHLLDSGLAEPVLVVVNGGPEHSPKRAGRWRQALPSGGGLWQVYERLIRRKSAALCRAALPPAFADVAMLTVRPQPLNGANQTFDDDDLARIAACNADVVIRFGFGILRGGILTAARLGVWSFHHGDPRFVRGQPPGFWEMYDRQPTTGVILQRLSEKLDGGAILHSGRFKTIYHSYVAQRDQIYWGAAPWLQRAFAQAARGDAAEGVPTPSLGRLRKKPTNLQFVRWLSRSLAAKFAVNWRSLTTHQQWTLGVVDASVDELGEALDSGQAERWLSKVRWMPETPGRFLADPFLLPGADGDEVVIYAEDFDWRSGIGSLVSVRYHISRGRFSATTSEWAPPHHCSYPYVFQDPRGQTWCIPESAEAGRTRRFSCADGKVSFSEARPLVSGAIIDPTIVEHDGLYWLFCTLADAQPNTDLHLFHAETLDGPWRPHPLNPIKSDIGGARPAGRPFVHRGSLVRPAQDCSDHYGGAIVLNVVERMTPDDYREAAWRRLAPPPGSRYDYGLHTLSWDGKRCVIDGARRSFNRHALGAELKGKWRRLVAPRGDRSHLGFR